MENDWALRALLGMPVSVTIPRGRDRVPLFALSFFALASVAVAVTVAGVAFGVSSRGTGGQWLDPNALTKNAVIGALSGAAGGVTLNVLIALERHKGISKKSWFRPAFFGSASVASGVAGGAIYYLILTGLARYQIFIPKAVKWGIIGGAGLLAASPCLFQFAAAMKQKS
jgi:hypothetical protein